MPTCTATSLATNNVGYGLEGLDRNQYQAALIYFKVLELAAIGGTDYRNTMKSSLILDAIALVKTMTPDQMRIAALNVARNNAIAAGASVPSSLSALNSATACCFQSTSEMDNILLLLDCKLGVSKAYPQ